MERPRQLRVVVADDREEFGKAATRLLAPTCDVVATVRDGVSAIAATSEFEPDVVILDIAMPGLDGFQTAARIQASGSSARIVFLSSYAGDDFVLAGVARGASGFVSKSEMYPDLAEAVSHVAEGRSFVPSARVLPQWRRAAGHRHDLLPYATDEDLVIAVTGFVDSALEAGRFGDCSRERAAPERTGRGVRAARRQYRRAGRFRPLHGRRLDDCARIDSRRRHTGCRFVCGGNGSARRPGTVRGHVVQSARDRLRRDRAAARRARRRGWHASPERIASVYTAARPVSILCGYSTGCCDDAPVYAGICAQHSTIVSATPTR